MTIALTRSDLAEALLADPYALESIARELLFTSHMTIDLPTMVDELREAVETLLPVKEAAE